MNDDTVLPIVSKGPRLSDAQPVTVTAEQVKSAALAAGISEVPHHDCAICGEWTCYVIEDGELFYDSNCGCGFSSRPRHCDWQEAANWINMQTHTDHRVKLAARFGLQLT